MPERTTVHGRERVMPPIDLDVSGSANHALPFVGGLLPYHPYMYDDAVTFVADVALALATRDAMSA